VIADHVPMQEIYRVEWWMGCGLVEGTADVAPFLAKVFMILGYLEYVCQYLQG
jgi:hypothetical protein